MRGGDYCLPHAARLGHVTRICATHPAVALVCPSCEQARRGQVTSAAKAAAARMNGRKGGRPRALQPIRRAR